MRPVVRGENTKNFKGYYLLNLTKIGLRGFIKIIIGLTTKVSAELAQL